MVCYEVSINGEVTFTAGAEEEDSLEARIDKFPGSNSLILSMTTFTPSANESDNFINWGA